MLTVFSIYQYVKGKLEKTDEGTSAHDALWDVYQFIRVNMNSSYGMSSSDSTPISEPDWCKKVQTESKPNPDWYLKERAAQFMKHELEEDK